MLYLIYMSICNSYNNDEIYCKEEVSPVGLHGLPCLLRFFSVSECVYFV